MKKIFALMLVAPVLLGCALAVQGCAGPGPRGRTAAAGRAAPQTNPADAARPEPVRCVVIGGLMETGLWPGLAERFTARTGIPVTVVASGNKTEIAPAFVAGKADLVVMHASDAILNLVADGYAADPQPWARNDMVIVGPANDPAGVKGMTDAAEALRKIAAAKAPFVVHSSLGAQEVLRALLDAGGVTLDPDHTTVLFNDHSRQVLRIAGDQHAYTMAGRIPFLDHKLPNDELVLLVGGDPRLRRPYLVAVANPVKVPGACAGPARELAAFLREPETQAWISEFGRGRWDDRPLFFPVEVGGGR